MADRARSGFPISVTFTDGELPTATKLTSLAKQARRGLQLMEYAVGDIWNQGGDSILAVPTGGMSEIADEPLMIPNLGRALGSPRLVSPRVPYLPDIIKYTHSFESDIGRRETRLPFLAAAVPGWTWSTGHGEPSGSPKTTRNLVTASGDWWYSTLTGDLYFFNLVASQWTLTYKPIVPGDVDSNATYNIIPDPDTDSSCGFQGLKLEYFNGVNGTQGYKIYLPPRQPLNLRRLDQSPQDDIHSPVNPSNQTTTPADAFLTFWQDDSVAGETGANAAHYRYTLPKIITDNWSNSATIPAGLVYLWDPRGTGTIIEGVVFAAEAATTPRTWHFIAIGSNLTAWLSTSYGLAAYPDANLKLTTHGAALYPANGLRLITVGTSVAQLASSTHQQFMDHDHGAPSLTTIGTSAGKRIGHRHLNGLVCEGTNPQLEAAMPGMDDHVQYLERHGYSALRDKYRNMFLGDFHLASVNSGTNYYNLTGNSNKIKFGPTDEGSNHGAAIYYNATGKRLDFELPRIDSDQGVARFGAADTISTNYIELKPRDDNFGGVINSVCSSFPLAIATGAPIDNYILLTSTGLALAVGEFSIASVATTVVADLGQGFSYQGTSDPTGAYWQPIRGTSLSGWAGYSIYDQNMSAWVSTADNDYVRFRIATLPHGCTLRTIKFVYATSDTTAGRLKVALVRWDIDSTTATNILTTTNLTAGTAKNLTAYTAGEAGYGGTPTNWVTPGAWDRSKHQLELIFTTDATAAYGRAVLPHVRLCFTYTNIDPWQST